MGEGFRNRRKTCDGSLRETFESNIHVIEKTVWEGENDLTREVPVNLWNDLVYGKGKKSDIPDENLFSLANKISKKVMVSATISWYGLTNLIL